MTMALDRHGNLDLGLTWHNSFALLGEDFYTSLQPQPLPKPYWVGQSRALGHDLGLHPSWLASVELLEALSGNRPIASCTAARLL